MTHSAPDPELRAKRGRVEVRTVIAIVIAVLLGGALYVALFGSPNAENRARDSTDSPIGVEPRPAQQR